MKALEALLEAVKSAQHKDTTARKQGEELITVHHMTSAVASVYEKIRVFLDYNEEHLLRKNAIYRILRRRKLFEGDPLKISENLIKELISARYLENNKLPESRIGYLAQIIHKYSELFAEISALHGIVAAAHYDWIMQMAACEIEESLVPHHTERVFIRYLYAELGKRIEIVDPSLTQQEKELLLYVAVNRTLIKSDKPMLEYLMLSLYYPQWHTGYHAVIRTIAEHVPHIQDELSAPIEHTLAHKLVKAVTPYATKISILRQFVMEHRHGIEGHQLDEEYVRHHIAEICAKRYQDVAARVRRSSFRSIIYILLTKVLLALVVEVPFDRYILGEFNYLAVAVNVTFPPLLMMLIAFSTAAPGEANTNAMIDGILDLLRGTRGEPTYVRMPKRRSTVTRVVFNAVYALAFLLPFALIVLALHALDFSPLSIMLFLVFMSIVSFFGVRIRRTAKELIVLKQKENLMTEIFDFFSLPLISFGRWMSLNFSKINVFVFVLDFIIEAPFKLLLQAFEEWMGFMREKKEDMD